MPFQSWSSVAIRYAKRLHTRARWANEATSAAAQSFRIWVSISGGRHEIGEGGGGDPSVCGGAGGMESEENEAMRSKIADDEGAFEE